MRAGWGIYGGTVDVVLNPEQLSALRCPRDGADMDLCWLKWMKFLARDEWGWRRTISGQMLSAGWTVKGVKVADGKESRSYLW